MNPAYERYLLRRETMGKPLLEAIRQAAAARGLDLPDVKESPTTGTDVMLLNRSGHVGVNRADDGGIDIAVWGFGLLAAGRTGDVEAVVDLLGQISAGGWTEAAAPPFLTVFDTAGSTAEIEARWRWLLAYEGDDRSLRIIKAVGADPLLRAQRPITDGHTTLALVKGRAGHETHRIQFYPARGDDWELAFRRLSNSGESRFQYTRGLSPAEAVAAAVVEVTDHWTDPVESIAT